MTIDFDKHESMGTNYTVVDSDVSCMLTRFKLRTPIALIRFFIHYRRVKRQADKIDGLIASVFLVEDLTTCYTMSFWKKAYRAIPKFNVRAPDHIHAANSSFEDLKLQDGKPVLWSAQFRLSAVSPNNFRWDGVEFGKLTPIQRPNTFESVASSG